MCVYNGVAYRQGQQWYDGCDLVCRCEDAMKGFYRCQQRYSLFTVITAYMKQFFAGETYFAVGNTND